MKLKIFLVVLILISIFCISTTASAMTEMERQTLITQLKQQMLQLIQQIVPMIIEKIEQIVVQEQTNPSWCHTFYSNIGYNQSGTSETVYLHIALAKQGISYSPDNFYTYSPNGTLQAVIEFQTRYGISPHSGYVGPTTRAKLNQLYGCGTTITGCSPNWSCGNWGICSNSQHIRTCTDSNHCGTTTNKPTTTQSCGTTCTPNWQTGAWSTCTSGQQTRTVTDLNYCGVTINKPTTTQSCTASCSPNWSCGNWGTCYSGNHTRTCTDSNHCGITEGKPATTETCTVTCTSFNYSSYSPSVCPPTGIQTRTVTSRSPSGCVGDPDPANLTQTCIPQPSIDIKANNSDGPLNLFLTLGSGASVNPSGGITLTLPVNLTWTGFEVQSCSASDTLTPTIFSGYKPSSGSEMVTLSGTIPGTSINDKVTDTFKVSCITTTGSTINNTVIVNLYYTVSGTCTPNWSCGTWGACVSGHHTRTCTDLNGCGSLVGKPAESESCTLQLTTINLTPASATVYVGRTQQLTAATLDQNGNPIAATLTWTSSNPSVAPVNSNGLVTAVGIGTAIITASSGSVVSNSVQIIVQPQPTSITVTPAILANLIVGENQQLTARDQNQRDITNEVTWSSGWTSAVTVDSNGLVTAVGVGGTNIMAYAGSVSFTVPTMVRITHLPPSIAVFPTSANLIVNNTQQLTARDQNQYDITNEANWASSNNSIATVNNGLVTAVGTGTATITASSGSVTSNSSTITVFAGVPTATITGSASACLNSSCALYNIRWSSTNANYCAVPGMGGYNCDPSGWNCVPAPWTCNNLNTCTTGYSTTIPAPQSSATTYTINCTGAGTATNSVRLIPFAP